MNARSCTRRSPATPDVPRLASGKESPRAIVEELYLLTYARLPTEEEQAVGVSLFEGPKADRRPAVEDLLWALLNSAEFVFKD